ncbi:conserved hypothetical protein [Ancylobacter novellus DSM 506]|uniref:Uncharacterized protein n=1 Tax=Ancylobacter novellus (strain ATCC 8093 / DSM 506 / JCM 20403 / CCM 1077 / IAM 12100 / NBRC 12443 / NCIMB 10456) TaxID=639283 RepID=D7A6R9_ANCN5|nr:hypothetical protein [Ancylobacter novellus]ADH90267.1 conserved hypothetical protein [Ancylobacter novellus DSM 506]
MADYYPLLARAIGGLPDKSAEARKAVYERARRALTAQLRAVEPPLPEDDVEREQQALENAIRRIEADHGVSAPAAPTSAPNTSAPATPSPATPPVTPAPSAPAVPPPPRPAAAESPSAPVRPAEPTGDFAPSEAEAVAAGIEPEGYAGKDEGERHDWRSEAARMVRAREAAALSDDDEAGQATADDGDSIAAEVPEETSGGSGRVRLFGALIFLALLIAGAVVGYTQRETILALVGGAPASAPQTAQAPARPATPDAPKSTDRIAQAPDSSRPAQSGQPAQPAQNAPSGTAAQGIDAPQRAVLFEESAGGGEQGLQQYVGTVKWSTERSPGSAGTAPDVGIRADITIPARDISATLTLRRNQDTSIPASHIIEVQFKLPPNFDLGNVSNVPGMRAKASESAQGAPLVGLAVRVAPSYFLIGLSALDSDIQRNLSFLITRNWLDLPIVFENGRRAILVLEKGEAGDQAFRQAFSAWGLAAPPAKENNAPAP